MRAILPAVALCAGLGVAKTCASSLIASGVEAPQAFMPPLSSDPARFSVRGEACLHRSCRPDRISEGGEIARIVPDASKIVPVIRPLDLEREHAPFAGSDAAGPREVEIAARVEACDRISVGREPYSTDDRARTAAGGILAAHRQAFAITLSLAAPTPWRAMRESRPRGILYPRDSEYSIIPFIEPGMTP